MPSPILRRHIAPAEKASLRRLLEDTDGLYEITKLKRDPRDFTYGEIQREIGRGEQIGDLYRLAHRLLPELDISNESIRYYASLVAYYSVYQLKRFDEWTAYLYLLCFVSYRYRRFHDNLIGSLLYHVRGFADEAKEEARQRVYEQQAESGQNLQKAGQVLKLFTDDGIGDGVPFREARAQAFGILEREKLASVADRIAAKTGFDEAAYEWEHIDGMAKRFKGQLRPVLQAVAFEAVSAQDPLLEAAAFLKEAFRKGKPLSQCPPEAFPVGFVPESAKRYLYAQDERGHKRLLPDRYEFLVYRQLRQGVDAIDISCRDLVNYQTGRIDFTTALDAQRQIRQTWLDYLKAQVEQQIRLAEIERLVGAPL